MRVQDLVDKANDAEKPLPPASFDDLIKDLHTNLENYRQAVDDMGGNQRVLKSSDRKKMLALPFYLAKRGELPEPKRGQKEWTLFKTLYGKDWNAYDGLKFDPEEKITEFNYEKFLPKHALQHMDTESEDFKNMIKMLNYTQKTEYE